MKSRFLRLGSASSTLLVLISLAVLAPAAENARSLYVVKKRVFYFAAGPADETHGLFGSIKAGQTRY